MGRLNSYPDRDTLVASLLETGSAAKTAEIMKIHPHTVRKYAKLYGLTLRRGPSKDKRRWSAFARWLKENPKVPLPPSVKDLAELTGISKNSIKSYLYRLRKSARSLISSQPWKNGKCVMWTDQSGLKIPDQAFRSVRSFVGTAGNLKFVVRLKDGSPHIFYITLKRFKEMYQ